MKSYEPQEIEPEIYAAWEAAGVFKPREEQRWASAFSMVMPPPNANGNLHIGHGLTIALEDVLVRYHRLRGVASLYVPGADHAGFETWVVYERMLEAKGRSRFDFTRNELYARVWDFVQEQRGNMELQLRALGASCDWGALTFTLDKKVVLRVYQTFERMWREGMVYRGKKLVNYCTKHQTAFADIEVVHEEERGVLYDIAYPYEGGEIVVSTTRPETMFGDVAVAVNPNDERYAHLAGRTVRLPLAERDIPVIFDEHADMEYGTGAVKITPAHDFDDFEVGERHDLPKISVIGFDGKMLETAGEFAGLDVMECRKRVVAELERMGLLRGKREIEHAVAKCYKCGTVIEPLLMEQWFVDTEKLASLAIDRLSAGEVEFYPGNKREVLVRYLEGLKDWNVSRQIPWGIAIPMYRRKRDEGAVVSLGEALSAYSTCGVGLEGSEGYLTEEGDYVIDGKKVHAEEMPEWIFDRRAGFADGTGETAEYGTGLAEIEVNGVVYERDSDTFDTWFSSAHWPIICTNWQEGVRNAFYPLDVMETGADILFAWVARMVMMGVYVTGEVPFREVYLHGLVLDKNGQKMSKSKGNVLNPMELVARYGSDAFRLGILKGRSAGMNQAFSENSVVMGRNLCNKLWNMARFIQGIVDEEFAGGSDPNSGVVKEVREAGEELVAGYETKNMGEDWILREINQAKYEVERLMEEYRFAEAVEVLYDLAWNKYADWFLESQKIYRNVGLLKRSFEALLVMMHAFLPFVTEAIWQSLEWTEGMIVVQKWPSDCKFDPISAENFERLMVIVLEVRRALAGLSEALEGKKCGLLFDNDALVDDNSLLVQFLTKVSAVRDFEGMPRGMKLPLVNHELYLDVSEEVVLRYREGLEERILAVGREADVLRRRLLNPKYVERAPAELVAETRKLLAEKEAMIERLREEMRVV